MSISGSAPSTWRFYQNMADLLGHRPIANEVNEELAAIDTEGMVIVFYFVTSIVLLNTTSLIECRHCMFCRCEIMPFEIEIP